MIAEVLSKDASAGDWIHDFVHSDNPKFAGKSKEQRKKQALAAYYAKQKNEEVVEEEVEELDELSKSTLGSYVKKASDDAMVSRKLGSDFENKAKRVKSDSAKGANTRLAYKFNSMAGKRRSGISKAVDRLTKEETVEEGWEDMLKAVKDRAKPQPSGGSGVKQGSRYGGSKQKEKPEHDTDEAGKKVEESEAHVIRDKSNMLLEPEKDTAFKKKSVPSNKPGYKVKAFESKRPESDTVPFVTNENTPLSVAKELAKKSMKKMKTEMLGKISN
jgi:hypothetical protein